MSFFQKIVGALSGQGADVDSNNQLKVTTETNAKTNPQRVIAVKMYSSNDDDANYLKSPETSSDYRLRVGIDTILMSETFNATAQNTGAWKHAFTTMTATQAAGFLNINAAGTSTVSGNFAYLQSWRYFPLIGTAPIAAEFTNNISLFPTANEVMQWGLGVATGAADPVDGVWFELTSAGLYGVMRYNSGTATKQLLDANVGAMPLNTNRKYVIVIEERQVEFWRDDIFVGEMPIPAAQGQPFLSTALPIFIQKYNANTVGSAPNTILKCSDITLSLLDIQTVKPWSHQMAGQGFMGQGLNGGTMGSNVTYPNSTNPTTALPVNTALTANLPTGLGGGQGLATLWNLAATDMIMSLATNPLGGVNQTARVMYITGVRITAAAFSAAWTAPAAGQHLLQWGIAWGSSASTLAQAESGSFATNTVKAFRRKVLGLMGWATGTAPIGTPADKDIVVKFDSPIVVNPGENVALVCKMLNGAATATGGLYFTYDFDHYFE